MDIETERGELSEREKKRGRERNRQGVEGFRGRETEIETKRQRWRLRERPRKTG